MHAGHAALLRTAREAVGDAGRVVALAFFPHPLTTLRPEAAPPRLSSWDQRAAWLRDAGADEVVRLSPEPGLLSLSPCRFVQRMVERHHPGIWVEGPDFRFGKDRAGDMTLLRTLGGTFGFRALLVPSVEVALTDLTLAPASSSLARWLLAHGRVGDTRLVLGRSYELDGVVEHGERRGGAIGCATANVAPRSMPPADGVYAGAATLPDGRLLPAALSVGSKPTFGDRPRAVEAHLLDPGGAAPWDGADMRGAPLGYGWPIRLAFVAWLREQIRYDRVEDLLAQIERDSTRTLDMFERRARQTAPTAGVMRS